MTKYIAYLKLACIIVSSQMYGKAVLINPIHRGNTQHTVAAGSIEDNTTIEIIVTNFEDAVIALRLAPELHARGKTVRVQAPAYLHPLMHMSPCMELSSATTPSAYTCHIYELTDYLTHQSLPERTTNDVIHVDQLLKNIWHDLFAVHEKTRVGICLTSYHRGLDTNTDCLTPIDYMPLGMLEHIRLFSFDQPTDAMDAHPATIYYFPSSIRTQPQALITILNELDLFITSCPAMAAAASMLAKPVWLIQSKKNMLANYTNYFPNVEFIEDAHDMHATLSCILKRLATFTSDKHEVITTEVQIGELIDKMTILEIKSERIQDEQKLHNIWRELASVRATFDAHIPQSAELNQLIHELKTANEALWGTEDLIRDKERDKCFDAEFIRLARSVYIQNDERCRAKRAINELLGSRLIEEKSYKPYN